MPFQGIVQAIAQYSDYAYKRNMIIQLIYKRKKPGILQGRVFQL
jgi:hypothetical protein